jgi:DNA-binding transcriptional regulator YiaG
MAAARRIPLEKPPSKADEAKLLRIQAETRAHIASQIRRLRIEAGLSIRALAMRANISSGYLSELEQPKSERAATIDLLVRIAYHLNVPVTTLLSSED